MTCVAELKLAIGENVNDVGDELPEGATTVWKNTAIRKHPPKTKMTKHRERKNTAD